jgi:hypothetical protein
MNLLSPNNMVKMTIFVNRCGFEANAGFAGGQKSELNILLVGK